MLMLELFGGLVVLFTANYLVSKFTGLNNYFK